MAPMAPITSRFLDTSSTSPTTITNAAVAPLWFIISISLWSQVRQSRAPVCSAITASLASLLLLSAIFSVLDAPGPVSSSAPHAGTSASRHTLLSPTVRLSQRQQNPTPTVPPFEQPTPPPSPLPISSVQPTPIPVSQPDTTPTQPTGDPNSNSTSTSTSTSTSNPDSNTQSQSSPTLREIPNRDECSAGLQRILAVIILEWCFEVLFIFVRCLADADLITNAEDRTFDINMRGYIFVRAIYAIPVVAINCAIYWIGGGPTGSCLSSFSEIQMAFTYLILYLLYCVFIVIVGLYRIDDYEIDKQQDENTESYYTATDRYPNTASGPPTRTSSYFRADSRRRRTATESTRYEQPKFRFNLGCCAINF